MGVGGGTGPGWFTPSVAPSLRAQLSRPFWSSRVWCFRFGLRLSFVSMVIEPQKQAPESSTGRGSLVFLTDGEKTSFSERWLKGNQLAPRGWSWRPLGPSRDAHPSLLPLPVVFTTPPPPPLWCSFPPFPIVFTPSPLWCSLPPPLSPHGDHPLPPSPPWCTPHPHPLPMVFTPPPYGAHPPPFSPVVLTPPPPWCSNPPFSPMVLIPPPPRGVQTPPSLPMMLIPPPSPLWRSLLPSPWCSSSPPLPYGAPPSPSMVLIPPHPSPLWCSSLSPPPPQKWCSSPPWCSPMDARHGTAQHCGIALQLGAGGFWGGALGRVRSLGRAWLCSW